MFEVVLRLSLREGGLKGRRFFGRIHFWGMVLLVGMLVTHLWLNA